MKIVKIRMYGVHSSYPGEMHLIVPIDIWPFLRILKNKVYKISESVHGLSYDLFTKQIGYWVCHIK